MAVQVESLEPTDTSGEPVLGIDLGTTNSCVAVVKDGKPVVIPTDGGHETIPSVIFLTPQKKILVGHKAVQRMIMFPERSVYGSKRFVGRPYSSNEVKLYGHFFRYELAESRSGSVAARIGGTVVPFEVVAGYLLASLRAAARSYLKTDVRRAVVTVPAYFGERQRAAVREAAKLAGLKLERLLNEPTAGAVAYGYGRGFERTILVYDLGGGTFDASVLRVRGHQMEVLATAGGPFLGGADFDDRLLEYVLVNLEREHQVNLRDNPVALQRLRFAAEKAKTELSDAPEATLDLPYLAESDDGHLNITRVIRREELEAVTHDLVHNTFNFVQEAMDKAKVVASDLDDVIMIGGQSRCPLVRGALQERFGQSPARNVHPDHAVALGAALVGASKYESVPVSLTDVLSAPVRLGLPGGGTRVLLAGGIQLPAECEFDVPTEVTDEGPEFRARLYRGEANSLAENEFLGQVRLPSSQALALTRTPAKVQLQINGEGILSVQVSHPMTGQTRQVELSIESTTQAEGHPAAHEVDGSELLSAPEVR